MGIHQARPHQRLRETRCTTGPARMKGYASTRFERLRQMRGQSRPRREGLPPTEEGGIAPDRGGRDCRHDRTTIPRPENSRQRQMRGTARSIPIEKEGNTESGTKAAESRVRNHSGMTSKKATSLWRSPKSHSSRIGRDCPLESWTSRKRGKPPGSNR